LRLVEVGPGEYSGGAVMVRRFSDQNLTLVDGVGLHIMHAHRTGICWSTDHHMRRTGVPLVVDEY
jgi:hypothetical protein